MHHHLITFLLVATVLFLFCPAYAEQESIPTPGPPEKHDLVLIHGLANKHRWSDSFLQTCLEIWGSGRVFVVYTGIETSVSEKDINGKKLVIGGGKGRRAGTASISEQASNITATIQQLQSSHGLRAPFSIIAHSMGGLVSRQYVYDNPGKVAGLITLGTPHHGSPLADSFAWMGLFLSATEAIRDLQPANVVEFNHTYPIDSPPLAVNKKIYTIRGIPDGSDCYGWMGELLLGWQILSRAYNTESDGLVPYNSAVINGAEHIADFPHYDHYDLVKQSDVAEIAADFLP